MAASLDTFLVRLALLTDGSRARGRDTATVAAAVGGTLLLGLGALAFAKAGDTAQALFVQLFATPCAVAGNNR